MRYMIRILSILMVFFYFQLFPQQKAEAPPHQREPFYEVIGVPINQTQEQLREQLRRYIKWRAYPEGKEPIIVGVPQVRYIPTYIPLPFYQPDSLSYIAYRNGDMTFFDPNCVCDDNVEVSRIKKQIALQRAGVEKLLIVRSALYHYYLEHKKLPETLEGLTGPYPSNYLSQNPFSQLVHSGTSLALENTGIIYQPERLRSEQVWKSMGEVLRIGGMAEPSIAIEPLEITVYESSFLMLVTSGPYPVRSYEVGLGAEQRTPTGVYSIKRKINQPVSLSGVYGTRGLVLSITDYAIHGTNMPSSIGRAVSKGCIRLHNNQVEELFSMVSLGTKVTITNDAPSNYRQPNASPFYLKARKDEETPGIVYHWKH
ncbi:L,D-transpeptidase [Aneurinibacillus migulanus]|uniref:L,D-transpeptidase n=1 Tax=Aneurinibacillus migulanus TaxID=47500 RepID=UPI00209F8B72|nr:L,D-transpeptidase [Aneurinibacillus migulanus]MCP1355199.1 L,D-transpeptidase [Aneurinibacillus migulanus]